MTNVFTGERGGIRPTTGTRPGCSELDDCLPEQRSGAEAERRVEPCA